MFRFITFLILAHIFNILNVARAELPEARERMPVPQKIQCIDTPENIRQLMMKMSPEAGSQIYDTSRWRELVDSIWANDIEHNLQLQIFDHFWDTVNTAYPCFLYLDPIDWDSLAYSMREEIEAGVSKGRFLGMMCNLVYHLNDSHVNLYDRSVLYTSLYPGLPFISGLSEFIFPACLTSMEDSTVLVYYAEPDNVFNLEEGDIILGYNNIPLSELVRQVIDKQLPTSTGYGSSNSARYHNLLSSVASSWNLYDTINILKYDGRIENYPADLMVGQSYFNKCFNIVPPEGVELPDYLKISSGNNIVSTVLPGTDIGYIAYFMCLDGSGETLLGHVADLVEYYKVKGLIIDIRTNFGGNFKAYQKAFQYLCDTSLVHWLSYGERDDPNDRMSTAPISAAIPYYNIMNSYNQPFNGPVAILSGPNAGSSGDLMYLTFSQADNVRTFGRPSAGAFGSLQQIDMSFASNFFASMQGCNFYLVEEEGEFLSHREYPVDQECRLTPEMVKQGKDDVIEAAKAWINNSLVVDETQNEKEISFYPNPAGDYLRFNCRGFVNEKIRIISQEGITLIVSEPVDILDISNLSSGIFFLRIGEMTTKFIKL